MSKVFRTLYFLERKFNNFNVLLTMDTIFYTNQLKIGFEKKVLVENESHR